MSSPRALRITLPSAVLVILLARPGFAADASPSAAAADSAGPRIAAPDSAGAPARPVRAPLGDMARLIGLESVTVDASTRPIRIAYENRRYRHSADALGWVARGGDSLIAFERREEMIAAAIEPLPPGSRHPFRVWFPTDADFPRPPRGKVQDPISHTVDLTVGPLMAYDLGRISQPAALLLSAEATALWTPWPGSRLRGSVLFPMYDNFQFDPGHPDVDNVRPGLITLEQHAWLPRLALASATVGLFDNNRYGVSVGAARPLMQGMLVVDGQADYTGYVAFNTEGIEYSSASTLSSFGALSYHPSTMDATVRVRYGRFLYGDHGADVTLERWFGDLGVAFSLLRSEGLTIEGVRVTFPWPLPTRPTPLPIRVGTVDRFPISFRTDATPVGIVVGGVGSREDYLHGLSAPELEANHYRYLRSQGLGPVSRPPGPAPSINQQGMTGFVVTPWAGVQREGEVEVGFVNVPKKWSYNPRRGVYHNEIYYGSIGLLPHLEGALRITRTPGFNPFSYDAESQLTTDTDHMASFRLALLEPRDRRPGLSVGVDDVRGTRRYHSSYLVTGMPFSIFHVQNRFSLGYASPVFTASRHVLDGSFGAIEVSPWRAVAAQFEYDTEKMNVGLGINLGFGLRLHAAALNMESLSVGVGWHHKL